MKTKAPMPPRFNEVPAHPILVIPGDIKKAEQTKPNRAHNRCHNVGVVHDKFQISRDDINLGDMRVTNGAQRGEGGVTPGHSPVESPVDITRQIKEYSEEYCRQTA